MLGLPQNTGVRLAVALFPGHATRRTDVVIERDGRARMSEMVLG